MKIYFCAYENKFLYVRKFASVRTEILVRTEVDFGTYARVIDSRSRKSFLGKFTNHFTSDTLHFFYWTAMKNIFQTLIFIFLLKLYWITIDKKSEINALNILRDDFF